MNLATSNSRFLWIFFVIFGSFTSQAQQPLNDAEIAEVMEICHQIRFDFASLALEKAESEEVKEFASYILTDYREELSPIPIFIKNQNQSASDIKRDVKELTEVLKKNKGKEFDQAFLQVQMDLHKRLMNEIKTDLIPAAKNPELKKALSKVYDDIDSYVDEALDTYITINK